MVPRILLICLELLLLLKNWFDSGAGQLSVPLVSTDSAHGIIKSDIPTFHLVTAAMCFTIIVMAIYTVLVMMQLEIGVNCVELDVDVLGSISKYSSKLFVRQLLMAIRCHNRFLSSFQ